MFRIFLTLSAFTLLALPLAAADEWTQWRGPQRDAHVQTKDWPASLGEDMLKPMWRKELGPSYSGPIVSRDKIFVTETENKSHETIRALDRTTGEEIWKTKWEGAMKVPFFANRNGSWIRATPILDGDRLYVGGIRDVLVCLNANTGETIWKRDFPSEMGSANPTFGFVSSPMIDGDHIYVQAGAAFLKLNKSDGSMVWKTLDGEGGMWGSTFSSPVLTTLNGREQIVVQMRNDMVGVNASDGTVLWKREIPTFRGMNILTPTFYNDKIFSSSYRGKTFLFEVKGEEGALSLEPVWENKATAYMSSPVIIGDHVYMHLQNRRISCIDLKTGEETWRSTDRFGEYWSMVAQKDRILALDQSGELVMMKANPKEFEVLDRRQISEAETWAHLAVVDDAIFVRELNAIVAYRWAEKGDAQAASASTPKP